MHIKIIPRRNRVFNRKVLKALSGYVLSGKTRNKDYIADFKNALTAFFGAKYAVLTPTGRKGLSLIIDYYSFPDGAEIIMPAYTLKDLVSLIKEKGYKPVFVDINPKTYNLEAALLEEKINERTAMIIATHIFGMPCQIDEIVRIARGHNVIVVEDCAHAMGALYKGRRVGTFSDASFFSLETSKPVNTFGGGIVITGNKALRDFIEGRINAYPRPGMKLFIKVAFSFIEDSVIQSIFFSILAFLFYFKYTKVVTTNLYLLFSRKTNVTDFTYTDFQAYLGLLQLKELDLRNKQLMDKVHEMRKMFKSAVEYQANLSASVPSFYYNVIKTDRDGSAMRKKLLKLGVDVGVGDEITDNCPMYFKDSGHFPVTDEVSEKLLQLPMSYDFDTEKIRRIAAALDSSLES